MTEAGRPPSVAVVIPTVRPDVVRGAINSVEGQDWAGALEVVVLHDGGAPLPLARWSIPVASLGSPRREGPGAARNRAVGATRAEVVAFLDDDDEWLSHHLQLTVPEAARTGGLAFGWALVHHVDEGWERPLQIPFRRELLRYTNPVVLSSLVMTRAAFDALGGFSPDLLRYEDWDLLLRADRLGLPLTQIPVVTVRYRFSTRSASADLAAMAEAFAAFQRRHGLHDLPVTNFARMAREGLGKA